MTWESLPSKVILSVNITLLLGGMRQFGVSVAQIISAYSYDENVSVWDLRTMRRPVNVHATGGGVWRVKWHPRDPSLLAVACMHEGFQILKWTNDGEAGSQLETLVSYKGKHMSLGYGIDWSYGPVRDEASNEDLVASCSFYDHLLTLWKLVR
jgi:diphthamide biosynthesis protein 7